MINLTPIARQIQKKLFEKIDALGKEKKYPNNVSDDVLTQSDMMTRTTFIKMVSEQKEPVILMGGELVPSATDSEGFGVLGSSFPLQNAVGYDSIYGSKAIYKPKDFDDLDFDEQDALADTINNEKRRPIPGIKSIEVNFNGGSRASRKATINWTCWSFDEINRLTPHFLSTGKSVLLEWGWVYDQNSLLNLPTFVVPQPDGSLVRRDAYTNYIDDILAGGGDFDMVTGIVSNFEYTTRQDGAFDCTTELISTGVNIIDNFIPSQTTITPVKILKAKDDEERLTLLSKVQKEISKSDDAVTSQIAFDLNLSFLSFMEKLDVYIKKQTKKVFKRNSEPSAEFQNYKFADATSYGRYLVTQESRSTSIRPYEFRWVPNKYLAVRYENRIFDSWVRWGWFEDNVLSKFCSMTSTKTDKNNKVIDSIIITEFRSINADLQTGVKSSVRIKNTKYLETADVDVYILPGQFNPIKNKQKVRFGDQEIELEGDHQYLNDLADIMNNQDNFPPFRGKQNKEKFEGSAKQNKALAQALGLPVDSLEDGLYAKGMDGSFEGRAKLFYENQLGDQSLDSKDGGVGYLRNMLINVKVLKRAFENVNSIKEGVQNMFRELNSPINFWSFQIETDPIDTYRVKIIDDQNTFVDFGTPVRDQQTVRSDTGIINNGIFYFPTWQTNSIVKSQNITAKIPSAMQLAAMYGSNLDQVKNVHGPSGFSDDGAVLAGGLFNESEDRVLAGLDFAYKNFDTITIGNKDGLASQPLTPFGGSGDGIFEFLQTDVAYSVLKTQKEEIEELERRIAARTSLETIEEDIKKLNSYDSSKPLPILDFQESKDILDILGTEKITEYQLKEIKKLYSSKYEKKVLKKPFRDSLQYLAGNHYEDSEGDDNSSVLIPFDLELEIDGTGGIYPGNSFHSTYLPQTYKNKTVFQMFDVGHTVNSSTWTTSISGKMRSSVNQVLQKLSVDDVQQNLLDNLAAKLLSEQQFGQFLSVTNAGFNQTTTRDLDKINNNNETEDEDLDVPPSDTLDLNPDISETELNDAYINDLQKALSNTGTDNTTSTLVTETDNG